MLPPGLRLLLSIALAAGRSAEQNRSCFWSAGARFERFWSLADYVNLVQQESLGAPLRVDKELGMRHVYFVAVASMERAEYAIRMERTWMHAAANRIYLVDALIPGIPMSCQVVMNDGTPGPRRHRDGVAVSRLMIWMNQVRTLQQPGGLPPDTRWIVVLEDDVYVNLARLYYFLAGHASKDQHPVMFTHVLSDTEVYDFDRPCLSAGAAILSRAAFELLAPHASCKTCPYTGSNEISLAYCALYTAVPMVHVPAMHCHTSNMADQDRHLTADLLAHHWISAGGLAQSTLGRQEAVESHPFEEDFPNLACSAPSTPTWTSQQLAERIRFCEPGPAPKVFTSSVAESHLGPETIDDYFEDRWPHRYEDFSDVSFEDFAVRKAPARLGQHWALLRPAGAWLHRPALGAFLQELQRSGLEVGSVAFAFRNEGALDLRPGLVLSPEALHALYSNPGGVEQLTMEGLQERSIRIVHSPLLVPELVALPRSLTGYLSEGALSGVWAIGGVNDESMREDLETKAADRRFFAGLLQENFEDLPADACSDEALQEARRWQRFLHNDDEHIKVVRGFQSGRREFRTLHAMYRSSNEANPLSLRLPASDLGVGNASSRSTKSMHAISEEVPTISPTTASPQDGDCLESPGSQDVSKSTKDFGDEGVLAAHMRIPLSARSTGTRGGLEEDEGIPATLKFNSMMTDLSYDETVQPMHSMPNLTYWQGRRNSGIKLGRGDEEDLEDAMMMTHYPSILTDGGDEGWFSTPQRPAATGGMQHLQVTGARGGRRNSNGRLAKGPADSDEDEELMFAKHASIVTDNGDEDPVRLSEASPTSATSPASRTPMTINIQAGPGFPAQPWQGPGPANPTPGPGPGGPQGGLLSQPQFGPASSRPMHLPATGGGGGGFPSQGTLLNLVTQAAEAAARRDASARSAPLFGREEQQMPGMQHALDPAQRAAWQGASPYMFVPPNFPSTSGFERPGPGFLSSPCGVGGNPLAGLPNTAAAAAAAGAGVQELESLLAEESMGFKGSWSAATVQRIAGEIGALDILRGLQYAIQICRA
ncbi:unnamed protein product [Symbiodinium sp. CCMP2592]|nr:unnamed protein product [Symbiodinium sp. CCMP2592]